MKYFDRFKANVSHLTSKERLYLMDGNLEGKLVAKLTTAHVLQNYSNLILQ